MTIQQSSYLYLYTATDRNVSSFQRHFIYFAQCFLFSFYHFSLLSCYRCVRL